MIPLVIKSTLSSMAQEVAFDITRAGQTLAGKALTPRPVPFLTGDVSQPRPDPRADVNPSAVLSGQLYVSRNATIGPNVVIRGETSTVMIGRNASIGGK